MDKFSKINDYVGKNIRQSDNQRIEKRKNMVDYFWLYYKKRLYLRCD